MKHDEASGKLIYQEPISSYLFDKWSVLIGYFLTVSILSLAWILIILDFADVLRIFGNGSVFSINRKDSIGISIVYLVGIGGFLTASILILVARGTSRKRFRIYENRIDLPYYMRDKLKIVKKAEDFIILRKDVNEIVLKKHPPIKSDFKEHLNCEFQIMLKGGEVISISSIMTVFNTQECLDSLNEFAESISHRVI